jgi:uncharacterized protein (DUF2132 family)
MLLSFAKPNKELSNHIMSNNQSNNPLHGISLKTILNVLVEFYGWDQLGRIIDIRCFNYDPSINSSLKFLRKTPWARKEVEDFYIGHISQYPGNKVE